MHTARNPRESNMQWKAQHTLGFTDAQKRSPRGFTWKSEKNNQHLRDHTDTKAEFSHCPRVAPHARAIRKVSSRTWQQPQTHTYTNKKGEEQCSQLNELTTLALPHIKSHKSNQADFAVKDVTIEDEKLISSKWTNLQERGLNLSSS